MLKTRWKPSKITYNYQQTVKYVEKSSKLSKNWHTTEKNVKKLQIKIQIRRKTVKKSKTGWKSVKK